MDEPNHFFVCIYLKDGRKVGHSVSLERNFPETINDTRKAEGPEQAKEREPGFSSSFSDFVRSIFGFIEFVPLILAFTPAFSQIMMEGFEQFLVQKSIGKTQDANRIIYELGAVHFGEFRRLAESFSSATRTSRDIPRMLTVGLVSAFEYHLGQLMHQIAVVRPEAVFDRDKTLSVRDIIAASSIDDVKKMVLASEIDGVLRSSFEDQISWIEKRAGIDKIEANHKDWSLLIEVLERRNLFVHAAGIVNRQYLSVAKKHSFPRYERLKVGEELHVDDEYFSRAVNLIADFGVKLIQVVWRKLLPEETPRADARIRDLGYELLVQGKYNLAISLLEFASALRNLSSEKMRRMVVVNLANAHKLSGNGEKCEAILAAEDWSSSALEFKVCIAAIRGDISETMALMKRLGSGEEIGQDGYQEWPAFFHIRDQPLFAQTFKEIFGVEFVPGSKKRSSMREVLDILKSKSAASEEEEPHASGDETEQAQKASSALH